MPEFFPLIQLHISENYLLKSPNVLPSHAQYSICGKTRGVISNVFLTKPVNENLGGWEAPEKGLSPPPPPTNLVMPKPRVSDPYWSEFMHYESTRAQGRIQGDRGDASPHQPKLYTLYSTQTTHSHINPMQG